MRHVGMGGTRKALGTTMAWGGGADPGRWAQGARRGSGLAVTEGGVGAQLAVIALVAFAGAPAVVAAALDQVHLLELVLAHVSAEEAPAARAGRRVAAVEGAAPHVAHPQGVDLRPRGGVVHEGVVARDAVERAALVAVHVDAQHLAQQRRPAGRRGRRRAAQVPQRQGSPQGTGAAPAGAGPGQGQPGLWGQRPWFKSSLAAYQLGTHI